MHTLVIDCAGIAAPGWSALLRHAGLPQLQRRLRMALALAHDEAADDTAWLSPAERWVAAQLGLQPDAATMPWGALAAHARGFDPGHGCWALALPAHLELGRDSLTLDNPAGLALRDGDAQQLLGAVQPLLQESGWRIEIDDPRCWLLLHPDLAGVATADPVRAIGRNVSSWMPAGPAARAWRRLLTEMQMVWQYHPVNEARLAAGLPQVNTLWLHGCGALPPQLRNPFVLEAADAAASAWWRAASAGLAKLPQTAAPSWLQLLQPQVARDADAAAQVDALQRLDAAAAASIDAALAVQSRLRLVLAAEHGWVECELRRTRRWQFWRRADLVGLLERL